MRFLKNIFYVIISFVLIFSLKQGIFAQGNSDIEKIKLGAFIIIGLESNIYDSEKPDWFNEYSIKMNTSTNDKLEYIKNNALYATREQIEDIKILYSDDLLPLMFSPEDLSNIFNDFTGIEYLINLKRIGGSVYNGPEYTNGINGYLFSLEQVSKYYKLLVQHFQREDAKQLWPNLDLDTLRSFEDFAYDIEMRNYNIQKIEEKYEYIFDKIIDSNLNAEDKEKFKNELNSKKNEKIDSIRGMNAYDLSSPKYISEFEKDAIKEFNEIEKSIDELIININAKIDISVRKVWSDDSRDKEVIIKLIKKKSVINIDIDDKLIDKEEIGVDIFHSLRDVMLINNNLSDEELIDEYEFVTDDNGQILTLTLNNKNEYKDLFKNLPKYEKDGKTLIEYNIVEVKVEGYITSIAGNQEDGFIITNTKIENPVSNSEKIEITFINDNKEYIKVKVKKGSSIKNDSLFEHIMPKAPIKKGYKFKEWNTQLNGKGIVFTEETEVFSNMTVYAIYEKDEDFNYGSGSKIQLTKDYTLPKTGNGLNGLSYILLLMLSIILLLKFIVNNRRN